VKHVFFCFQPFGEGRVLKHSRVGKVYAGPSFNDFKENWPEKG